MLVTGARKLLYGVGELCCVFRVLCSVFFELLYGVRPLSAGGHLLFNGGCLLLYAEGLLWVVFRVLRGVMGLFYRESDLFSDITARFPEGRSAQDRTVNDITDLDLELLRQFVVFGEHGEEPVGIAGIYIFEKRFFVSELLTDIPYKFVVVDEVPASEVIDAGLVPVDEIMHLLRNLVGSGDVHHQVGKDLVGLTVFEKLLQFVKPGRFWSEYHGHPGYNVLPHRQPQQHVFYLYFEPAVDAF